jgi:hypothetical protein
VHRVPARQTAYNSCGNRHCPTCQGTAAARWLEAHAADLLPVPYFHLVFTLPNALGPLALSNPRIVYDLLLRCAAETVLQIAANPQRLGARTGVLAVLHTWGQTLQFHPHVHCVVPEAQSLESVAAPELLAPITPARSCPNCGATRMIVIEEFPPRPAAPRQTATARGSSVLNSSSTPGINGRTPRFRRGSRPSDGTADNPRAAQPRNGMKHAQLTSLTTCH